MRKSTLGPVALIAFMLAIALPIAGCGKYNELKARKSFKDANQLYSQGEYRRAAQHYEDAIAQDPNMTVAYFYLGNSYDNLYKVTRKGEPENDELLDKAISNYKIAAERETDPKMQRLALEYLVAAYGPDKLNDPEQAEPIVQRMIEMDPKEVTNYFALARIYEDSGMYEEAEEALLKAKEARPNEASVYTTLAGFYNRQGEFDKTVEALAERASREPNNPEAFQTLAAFYWEKAYRDFRLPADQKAKYVDDGLVAVEKALSLRDDYLDAVAFKNLLLREKAKYVKDRAEYDKLIAEANRLQQRAVELQKRKTAGIS
jgi:tetratricopeptide (TPR) repeat protein